MSENDYIAEYAETTNRSMEIIRNILAVGAGSFIGGAARYLISLAMKGIGKGAQAQFQFPWATLAVNLAGCLMIGLLWGILTRNATETTTWGLFLTVGLCGGFTTFSTFSKEALTMLQTGQILAFATYIAISVIAGITLVALGYYIDR